ncbi:MAG: sugar transferase [Ignavibacteria bacterium]|nr:sugar transferase [Ignavibacteria bacterium]
MFKSIFEYKDRNKPLNQIDESVLSYILKFINPFQNRTRIFDTSTVFNIETISEPVENFINLRKINYFTDLNKLLHIINEKLFIEGHFIGCVEIYEQRKKRIYLKFPFYTGIPVYFLDFVLNRIIPKLAITKVINLKRFRTRNNAISKAEVFGRLYSAGFEVNDFREINNLLYFIAKKVKCPMLVGTYQMGLLYKMKRIGKKGKIINVYKIRTMNPYAEFLQGYLYDNYNLKEGGKFRNDFRITSWGKFLRKYWLDELPMLYNVLKGDMKLVGVRPLSKQYFELYDESLKELRIKHKPGLVPPYYADMPKSFQEIMDSERRYLLSYERHKIKTDIVYFFKAFKNIIFNKARSS